MSTDASSQIAHLQAELLQRIAVATPTAGLHGSTWERLDFIRADAKVRRTAAFYRPCLCVVAQGRKLLRMEDGHVVGYDPMHYLVVGASTAVDAEIREASPERPLLVVKIALDQAVLTEVLRLMKLPATPGPTQPAMGTSRLDARLLDCVVRILRACDDPVEQAVLMGSLQRELCLRLAQGPQAVMLRQIVQRGHQAHRVARAIRHAEQNFAKALGVADLARVARMGESTFHRAFREVAGTTPLRFLKRTRLMEARNLMLNEDLTAAEAAGRVGYRSPSQFSRDFRALFGGPPRAVVSAMRAEAMG